MPNYPDSIQDLEPLSGLYIRKRFLNEVRTFLDQKHPQGWCIVAIDIENFKLFNDWYGQDSGDYLLLEIAAYLRNLHQEDNYITGHFSADDFFICMPDDGHKLRHIYATIYHYIDKLEQDDSFLPSIGVYRIEDESLNLSSIFSPNVTWRPVNWSAWRRLPDGRNLTELLSHLKNLSHCSKAVDLLPALTCTSGNLSARL